MTGNQINYWNLQEQKRANLINEGIKSDTLEETKRSNLINESIAQQKQDSYASSVKSQNTRNKVQNRKDTVTTLIQGIDTFIDNQQAKRDSAARLIGQFLGPKK